MFVIIGFVVVFGSIIGGYLMSHGVLHVLFQPAEMIIILGAAFGAFIISNTKYSLGLVMKSMKVIMGDPGMSKAKYLEILGLLNSLFVKMHREGVISIEQDIEKPEGSSIFNKYPSIAKDKHTVHFIGDTLRVYLTTGDPNEIDSLMEVDMKSMHEEESIAPHSIGRMAESMPGMGIVAAVLGVVLTMGKISEPPEVLGHHIGAALVGTFIGILFCYGVFGPMGAKIEQTNHEHHMYFAVIKEAVAAAIRGSTPIIAVEYGRRAIPHTFRPTFAEMEEKLKS
ncbi:flagellar motor stator protein MotA [Nitratidesulfovibrio sp.]|uniref:flagellar motor stator protein MotA n=1 Tax=Nitratidesulfovibrio sp. TaxID=2802297 RepID=UPI003342A978